MCKFTLHKFYMNLGDTSLHGSILQMFWNASILWTGCSCCVYTHVSAGAENNVFPSHLLFCFFSSYGLGTVSGRVRACHGTYNKGFSVSERVRVVPE